jgi:hypothetical protein
VGDGYIDIELSGIRRIIAKRLTESKVSGSTTLISTLFSFNPAFREHGVMDLCPVMYGLNLGLLFWVTLFVCKI